MSCDLNAVVVLCILSLTVGLFYGAALVMFAHDTRKLAIRNRYAKLLADLDRE